MLFDVIVLAGGRSSRLGGQSKAQLILDGRTLLQRTLDAVPDARATVVVGVGPVAAGVHLTRETPAFGGPCAALAAGVERLEALDVGGAVDCRAAGDATLVLSCDMPGIGDAVGVLLAAYASEAGGAGGAGGARGVTGADGVVDVDGVMAVDGVVAVDATGQRQYLAAVYRRSSLRGAIDGLEGGVVNVALWRLLGGLALTEVAVPPGSTADVDTWADAELLGITRPGDVGTGENLRREAAHGR